MGSLNEENKLQADEKNNKIGKKLKNPENLKIFNILNFKTFHYKVTVSGNIIHSTSITSLRDRSAFKCCQID